MQGQCGAVLTGPASSAVLCSDLLPGWVRILRTIMTFCDISMVVFGVECTCVYREIGTIGDMRLVERP